MAVHLGSALLLGTAPLGSLLSNLAQFAASLLAVVAALAAARRSRRFARQFWMLTGTTFLLWIVNQAYWLYYENWLQARMPLSSPAYMVAFFAFAPLAMVLFLNDYAEPEGFDWLQTLDFIHLGVVLLFAYLFLFHIPSFWVTREEMSRTLMWVFDLRNGILTGAFAVRAWGAHSPAARSLYRRMAMVLALYSLGAGTACYVFVTREIPTGTAWDLAWTVPFVLAAVAAARWQDVPSDETEQPRHLTPAALLALNLLPLILPLLVLFIASSIAQEQLVVAAVAVTASFACYGMRLVIIQLRKQRTTEALRHAVNTLRKTEDSFRLLFAANPEPMWVFDSKTLEFLEVNHAAVEKYGYSREEFLRLKVTAIRPSEDVPQLLEVLSRKYSGPHFGHWRHCLRDGRLVNVEIVAQSLDFAGRKAILAVVKDISERMQLGEQLRQAQKMEAVGRLAGGVAHDFNNVLTVVTGYTSMMLEQLPPGHEMARDLREVAKASERATALTRQLLAFSRQQILQPKVMNLNSAALGVGKMLERLIGEDIELGMSLAADLGSVNADPGQIEQVIMNLAVNARDAMPEGGRLTFETRNTRLNAAYSGAHFRVEPGEYVMLAVSDTGHGMDAQTRARVFEPFFTTKEKGKGTGLGLSTVYGIVKQSGGYIWVYSEPGLGTTFKIYLPRVHAAAETLEEEMPLAASSFRKETVLLVEDDDSLRELTRRILESNGYSVVAAAHPAEAEALFHRHGPVDLLLTDVIMPGMSGKQLADRLTELQPGLCVIFMSGYTDEAIVHRGVLEPGTHFLQKPFSPHCLRAKLHEVLEEDAIEQAGCDVTDDSGEVEAPCSCG
ncbi:MAG: ATP-binding protein [Terriglobales bacterium]